MQSKVGRFFIGIMLAAAAFLVYFQATVLVCYFVLINRDFITESGDESARVAD